MQYDASTDDDVTQPEWFTWTDNDVVGNSTRSNGSSPAGSRSEDYPEAWMYFAPRGACAGSARKHPDIPRDA